MPFRRSMAAVARSNDRNEPVVCARAWTVLVDVPW